MQITVVVEKIEGAGYRARSGEPMVESAEGPTPDEALEKLGRTDNGPNCRGGLAGAARHPGRGQPVAEIAGMSRTILLSMSGRKPSRKTGGKTTRS